MDGMLFEFICHDAFDFDCKGTEIVWIYQEVYTCLEKHSANGGKLVSLFYRNRVVP